MSHSVQFETTAAASDSSSVGGRGSQLAVPVRFWQTFAICLLTPFALVAMVLQVSPNFSIHVDQSAFQASVRSGSFGGDFLQEYVGGHIWNHDRERLYDWEYSKSIQHQPAVVGFSWKQESFFPMVYPPYHYQLASFFSEGSYPRFAIAFSFFNAVALFVAAAMFVFGYRPLLRKCAPRLCAAVLFVPLLLSLNMGQKSAILLAILTVSFVLLHRNKPLGAGIVFGLIAFKPHFAILIGLTMLFKKQWWFVAGSLVTLGILVGISLVSPQSWQGYIGTCLGFNEFVTSGGYQLHESHSLWGAAELLAGERMPWLVKPLAGLMTMAVLVAIGWTMRGPVELSSVTFGLQFSVLVLGTVLSSPHFYTYDLTILLLPLAICVTSSGLAENRNLNLICLAVFVGITFCRTVALGTGFQMSVLLLGGWIAMLAWRASQQIDSRCQPAANAN